MDYSLLLGFHFNTSDKDLGTKNLSYKRLESNDTVIQMESKEAEKKPAKVSELNLENPGIPSSDGRETYFVGMIDILQAWNFSKKSERCFKIYFLRNDKVYRFPIYVILHRKDFLHNQLMSMREDFWSDCLLF